MTIAYNHYQGKLPEDMLDGRGRFSEVFGELDINFFLIFDFLLKDFLLKDR